MKVTFFFFVIIVMSSCGKNKNSDIKKERTVTVLEEKQPSEGYYRAILRPLNNHLSGFIPTGVAEVYVEADEFNVTTLLDDDAKVTHIQNIHLGKRCPQLSDDKNNDSFIDIKEAIKASGDVLLSLDNNLLSESDDEDIYPRGKGFTYKENAPLKLLEEKIIQQKKQHLNLDGRVVIIRGAAPTFKLGPTLSSTKGFSKELSIPVVCGVLKRVH